jgi:hypothetical protein
MSAPAVRRPALTLHLSEANLKRPRARAAVLGTVGRRSFVALSPLHLLYPDSGRAPSLERGSYLVRGMIPPTREALRTIRLGRDHGLSGESFHGCDPLIRRELNKDHAPLGCAAHLWSAEREAKARTVRKREPSRVGATRHRSGPGEPAVHVIDRRRSSTDVGAGTDTRKTAGRPGARARLALEGDRTELCTLVAVGQEPDVAASAWQGELEAGHDPSARFLRGRQPGMKAPQSLLHPRRGQLRKTLDGRRRQDRFCRGRWSRFVRPSRRCSYEHHGNDPRHDQQ